MISIVIPNYNGARHIKGCMEALARQTLKAEEIIIVDNCSTDGSLELIKDYYPSVKLISLDKNYGFSKAVNVGIKHSKHPYVVLLNNDTEAESTWLEELYKAILSRSDAFSCSSNMLSFDNREIVDDAGDGYTILGWAVKYNEGKHRDLIVRDREVFSSCGGAAIYRKSVFQEIGYFYEDFFAYLEDVDIGFRARSHGYKNYLASKAIIYHKGSATTGGRHNSFKMKLVPRNNIWLIYRNMLNVMLIFNLPFILLGYLIKLLFFIVKGYGREYISSTTEGIKGLSRCTRNKYGHKKLRNALSIQGFLIKDTFRFLRVGR